MSSSEDEDEPKIMFAAMPIAVPLAYIFISDYRTTG
jgi:hypothetical protein